MGYSEARTSGMDAGWGVGPVNVWFSMIFPIMESVAGVWVDTRLLNLRPPVRRLLVCGLLIGLWVAGRGFVFDLANSPPLIRMLASPLVLILITKLVLGYPFILVLIINLLFFNVFTGPGTFIAVSALNLSGIDLRDMVLHISGVELMEPYRRPFVPFFSIKYGIEALILFLVWRFRLVLFDANGLERKAGGVSVSKRLRRANRLRGLWLLNGLMAQGFLIAFYVVLQQGQIIAALQIPDSEGLDTAMRILAILLFFTILVLVREMERGARVTDHLDQAERLIQAGRLTASVTHDIKNLITALRSFLQPLGGKPFAGEPAFREQVSRALAVAGDIERLVRNFLVVASPEPDVTERVDLSTLLRETGHAVAGSFAEKGIGFDVDVPGGLALTGIPVRLRAAVLNLLVNALEHAPAGGRVVLRAQQDRQRGLIAVEVENTGSSIPPELAGKVFEPFYTTKERGHGLGLAIVRQVAESHGGRVEVESWPEAGGAGATGGPPGSRTLFRIWLPAAAEEGKSRRVSAGPPGSSASSAPSSAPSSPSAPYTP